MFPGQLVCVGGPFHGRVVDVRGWSMKVADLYPDRSWVTYYTRGGNPVPTTQVLMSMYRRESIALVFGSLMLSGECWVWQDLKDWHPAAMGLMLAEALRCGSLASR